MDTTTTPDADAASRHDAGPGARAPDAPQEARPAGRRTLPLPVVRPGVAWLVLAIGLAATGLAFERADEAERDKIRAAFDYRTDRVVRELKDAFIDYEQTVRAVAGLVEAGEPFTRAQWRSYFRRQPPAASAPGLQAVGFAPVVSYRERGAHESAMRDEGMPGYVVTPEGTRDRYFPVTYLRAMRDPPALRLGVDIAGTTASADALLRAGAAGRVSGVHAPPALADGDSANWWVVNPVYRAPVRGTSAAERAEPIGYVVAAIDMGTAIRAAIGEDSPLIAYRAAPVPPVPADTIESAAFVRTKEQAEAHGLVRTLSVPLGDREWQVEFAATPALRQALGNGRPWQTLAAGLLISALLFAITATLARTRSEALRYADDRTRALAAQERKLASYIERSLDCLTVVDASGRYLEANPAACEVLGYAEQDLLQMSIGDLVAPVPGNRERGGEHFARVLAAGESRGEVVLQRRDGTRFVADINAVRLSDDRFLGIFRDVTARREAEEALRREHGMLEERVSERTRVLTATNEALQQEIAERRRIESELVEARVAAESAAAAKASFLAHMSHEIRTPLNAVLGLAALLDETRLTPEQRGYLEGVRLSGDSLLGIINDILDFSKIDAGVMELESETFDLAGCVEETLQLLGAKAGEAGLELVYRIGPDVPALIRGDKTRLRQVLLNLAGNAIKFTERGEVVVAVDVAARAADELVLRFAVRDTGIGIPADKQPSLFRPFTQADSSTTRRFGGTGLGLAICGRLVGLMGGSIAIDSAPGRGSTFTFTIRTQAVASVGLEPPAMRAYPELRGRRVLLVDDNEATRAALADLLTRWHVGVVTAGDFAQARRALAQDGAVDALIVDEELLHEWPQDADWLADPQRAPCILLTPLPGRARVPDDRIPAPVAGRVRKPVKPERLCGTLRNVLGGEEATVEPVVRETLDASLARRLPMRLLVAEDSDINRDLVRNVLSRLGYEADAVANGIEAVECYASRRHDLLLMDLQMPGMDGIEAARRIRALGGRQPRIVAMTANALQQDRERCLEAGMDDFVTKPVLPADIQRLLQQWGKVVGAERRGAVRSAGDGALMDERTLADLRALDAPDAPGMRVALIERYLAESRSILADLHAITARGERSVAAPVAHRLAGASVSVGAAGLCTALRRLEDALRSDEADADAILAQVDSAYEATAAYFDRLIREESGRA